MEFLGIDSGSSAQIEAPAMLEGAKSASVPAGGVTQSIAGAVTRNSSNSRSIGQVNVTTSKELDAQTFNNMVNMAAG